MNPLSLFAVALFSWSASNASIVKSPQRGKAAARAEVDLVELNHFLDDHGREVFRQVVFYDWSSKSKQFEARAWRLIKHPSQLPRKQPLSGSYLVRWQDKFVTREVVARTMRETFSQQDPERVNRAILPENERRPLWPTESKTDR